MGMRLVPLWVALGAPLALAAAGCVEGPRGASSGAAGEPNGAGGVGGEAGSSGSAGEPPRACLEVAFADPDLELAVRRMTRIDAGPLPPERVAAIDSLTAVHVGSFAGIECLTGLRTLYANLGWAMEADPIGTLANLETLSLEAHSFYSIAPLTRLTGLQDLTLRRSLGLASLDPVRLLGGLRILDISENPDTPLDPLAELHRLSSLNIDQTTPASLAPLAGLGELTALYAEANELTDISALSGLTKLETLKLSRNQIADLSPLRNLRALKRLELVDNATSSLEPLSDHTLLSFLTLAKNRIADVSPLAAATELTILTLDENPLSDISPLAGLSKLSQLSLHATQVRDVSPLAGHPTLRFIMLRNTPVSDITPLAAKSLPRADCPRLDVRGAPLDAPSLEQAIPKLCADGWVVTWTDPDRGYCSLPNCDVRP